MEPTELVDGTETEAAEALIPHLRHLSDTRFKVYGTGKTGADGNIELMPFSGQGFVDDLRRRAKDSTVLDDSRFVADGNLVTAAGVSAGIDMALWLVGQIWDVELARTAQRYMQYEPDPPYAHGH